MKDRIETLKEYLKRLGNGEPLEAVRKDFVEVFKDVDPAEIMKAEQEMLAEGTPLLEVQKLCDVHAALFHGKTREEQIANAERAVHGWKRVREMTYNEVICYTLIKKYGHFVSVPDEPKQEKKKKFSLFHK